MAAAAEGRADGASFRVKCNEAAVGRWHEELGRARRRRTAGRPRAGIDARRLVRKAPAREMLKHEVGSDFELVAPDLHTGGRIQRDHVLMRCAKEEPVSDLQRRDLEGGLDRVARLASQVAGLELPGDGEPRNVTDVNFLQRRIALPEAGATIGVPLAWSNAANSLALRGHAALRRRQ